MDLTGRHAGGLPGTGGAEPPPTSRLDLDGGAAPDNSGDQNVKEIPAVGTKLWIQPLRLAPGAGVMTFVGI